MKMTLRVLCVCGWVSLVVVEHRAAAATFTPLGDLPGGEFDSVTTDISDDGLTIVGFSESNLGLEGFRWTREAGLVALSSITGEVVPTLARAVAENGVIAGQLNADMLCTVENHPGFAQGALWDEINGFVGLGGNSLIAHDLSADGSAATGSTCELFVDPNDPAGDFIFHRPYRWTANDGLRVLAHAGEAFGMSSDGSVFAGFGPLGGANQAFRWSTDLADPNFAEPLGAIGPSVFPLVSEAYDISANGEVIVGAYLPQEGAPPEGFRWSEDSGFVGIGQLSEFGSFAYDVSEDGNTIAGEAFISEDVIVATIWDPVNGLRNLQALLVDEFQLGTQLEGWTLIRSNGISADGQAIVGFGTNPDGNQEAWLVRLDEMPPPPGLSGDYNESGTVEQGDLDLVLLNWGADGTTPPAGWTNDLPNGLIDQEELDGVLLNWGNTAMALQSAGAVPEPSSVVLALVLVSVTAFVWPRTR